VPALTRVIVGTIHDPAQAAAHADPVAWASRRESASRSPSSAESRRHAPAGGEAAVGWRVGDRLDVIGTGWSAARVVHQPGR